MRERRRLPGNVAKLLKGYELRVAWFEIFECVRKLAVACLPVFFTPSGSASQLLFGLMVCFVCFGAYAVLDPFEDRGHDAVAASKQLRRRSYLVFPVWLVCTAAAWESARRNRGLTTELGLEAAYDLGLWALLLLLLQRAERHAQAG